MNDETMKKYAAMVAKGILTAMAAFVPFVFLYLLAAFVNWSLNPQTWPEVGRMAVGLFGMVFGVVTGILAGIALYNPRWFRSWMK